MRLLSPLEAADRAAGHLRSALTDSSGSEQTVLAALAGYLLLWTLYGAVAKSSQGLHSDMTEIVAWSRDLSFGYLKHPPLAASIVWLWFAVMPLAEWSYYLLAMLMPTIALWIAWRLSADYLDIEKRVVALALLTLIPFYNFHALKFNVNTVLMPVWAATTFWFLRSYTTRNALYAALAGLGAAACMLGKYWSVFLLAGLFVAALIDTRRGAYFRSAAPWLTVAVGLIALAPHLYWLVHNDFAPFGYALEIHGTKPFANAVKSVLGYLAGSLGYVAMPLIVALVVARRSRTRLADIVWPAEGDRRLVATAFWAPFLLPTVSALASGTELTSLWSMPAWTLLPVLLLSSPAVTLATADTRRVLIATVAVPMVMLLAAPGIALMVQRAGPRPAAAHAQLLAIEIERAWHEATQQPLRYVDGDAEIVYDVAAAAVDRPRALPKMPQPSAVELKRSGLAIVCFADDAACCAAATSRASSVSGGSSFEIGIVRDYFRLPGKVRRYSIAILPPQ